MKRVVTKIPYLLLGAWNMARVHIPTTMYSLSCSISHITMLWALIFLAVGVAGTTFPLVHLSSQTLSKRSITGNK